MTKDLREAIELLMLIDAEWRTDVTSTACFDSRIIKRTRDFLARKP